MPASANRPSDSAAAVTGDFLPDNAAEFASLRPSADEARLVPFGVKAEAGRDISPGARFSRQRALTCGTVEVCPSVSRRIVTGRPAWCSTDGDEKVRAKKK